MKKKRDEMSAGRRKMKDDLLHRENFHKRQKTSEEMDKKGREEEIQRLREEGRRRREQEQSRRAEAEASMAAKRSETEKGMCNPSNCIPWYQFPTFKLYFTESAAIKVKWNKKLADYTKEQIESIFSTYGKLDHVAVRQEKARAAVLFLDPTDAVRTTRNFNATKKEKKKKKSNERKIMLYR
jgi:hypothetical protein